MFRPILAALLGTLFGGWQSSAMALVGDDFSKDAPDLFCPAQVSRVVPLHQLERPKSEHDLGTDADFAIILSADGAKNASGTLKFFSKDRAYTAGFSTRIDKAVKLVFELDGVRNEPKTYYESPPVFVRLPSPVPLDAVWIYDIAVNGAAADCATLPLTYMTHSKMTRESLHSERSPLAMDEDAIRKLAAERALQIAQSAGSVEMRNCPQVSVDAATASVVSPQYSGGFGDGTALIKLALDANGRIADLVVLASSGVRQFDRAALGAVARSTYRPRQFLCTPIPGFYSFRVNFKGP